jgi:hypothetical protein
MISVVGGNAARACSKPPWPNHQFSKDLPTQHQNMILHGMKAFTGNPYEDALLKDFDAQKTWTEIQTSYLTCPTPSTKSGSNKN